MAEQKREDAIDSGDIGGAGIFLFGRELFTDSAFVARGGCDVEQPTPAYRSEDAPDATWGAWSAEDAAPFYPPMPSQTRGIGAFLRREALIICREGELEEVARSKTNK